MSQTLIVGKPLNSDAITFDGDFMGATRVRGQDKKHEERLSILREQYSAQIRRIKHLKDHGTKKELSEASNLLRAIKREFRSVKKAVGSFFPRATHAFYPRLLPLTLDEDGFVLSFDATAALAGGSVGKRALNFFREYGFVIFRDVLDSEQIQQSASEIWDQLEKEYPTLKREVAETYSALSSQTYGLASEPALFTEQMIRNRCNEFVVKALRLLLDETDILLSHDRWCFYRPTKSIESGGISRDMPEWKTQGNLHLDLNPWTYLEGDSSQQLQYDCLRDFSKEMNSVKASTGPHVQGVLAITENRDIDGGTVLVAGFHSVFSDWVQSLGPMNLYTNHSDTRVNRLVWRGHGAGSFKFSELDPIHLLKQRVSLRAGSFLVWDQRIVHGSASNDSSNVRMAQFIKAFRRTSISSEQFLSRSKAIRKHMEMAGTLKLDVLTEDALQVLGLTAKPNVM